MKNPGRFGTSGGEPDVIGAVGDETSAAGSEGPLVRQGGRQVRLRKPLPIHAAVSGDEQLELPLDRITERNAALFVPEGQGIIKCLGVGVFELQRPRFAAVCS